MCFTSIDEQWLNGCVDRKQRSNWEKSETTDGTYLKGNAAKWWTEVTIDRRPNKERKNALRTFWIRKTSVDLLSFGDYPNEGMWLVRDETVCESFETNSELPTVCGELWDSGCLAARWHSSLIDLVVFRIGRCATNTLRDALRQTGTHRESRKRSHGIGAIVIGWRANEANILATRSTMKRKLSVWVVERVTIRRSDN